SVVLGCDLVFDAPGTRTLTVTFSGGGPYAGATGSSSIFVGRGITDMELSFANDEELVGFGTATVAWRLVGPTELTSDAVVISAGGRELCRSSALAGTCDVPLDSWASQASITAHFV